MLARVLAATVAGGIVFFLFGWIVYGLILDPLVFRPNANPEAMKLMKDPPEWIFLILGNLVAAFLLAYIFDRWATIKTFGGGLIGGAILYFILGLYMQLMSVAFMKIMTGPVPVIADILGSVILGGLAGGVVGLVLGKMNKGSSSANS
jgi:hypothetical protein